MHLFGGGGGGSYNGLKNLKFHKRTAGLQPTRSYTTNTRLSYEGKDILYCCGNIVIVHLSQRWANQNYHN